MTPFTAALVIFTIFTLVYLLFIGAILYHLKQYTLPRYYAPRLVTGIFFLFSGLLWLLSLYFLFQIS